MQYKKLIQLIIAILWSILILHGEERKKVAQTGFQFLSVVSDGRASAMGEAMTTVEGYSNSLFFNPAGMARMPSRIDVNFSQNRWIADINHNAVSLALNPSRGRYGVFGFSLLFVDYGKIQGTMVWANEKGYIDTEIFQPTALAFGVGYARTLSDKFAVGGHIKSTYQYLGKNTITITDTVNQTIKNTASAVAFDFGTIYRTGWRSLAFGMSVRNFSEEIKFHSEGFQLPLTFKIGVSMDLFTGLNLEMGDQSLLISVDASHPRSYSERLNVGFEYTPIDILALRTGYLFNYDERGITAGFGINMDIQNNHLAINYAYTPFGVFDSVQRISLQLAI